MNLTLTTNPVPYYRWLPYGGEPNIVRTPDALWMFTRWENKGIAVQHSPPGRVREATWSDRVIILPTIPHTAIAKGIDTPGAVWDPVTKSIVLTAMGDPGALVPNFFERGLKMAMCRAVLSPGGNYHLDHMLLQPEKPWEQPFVYKRNALGVSYYKGGLNEFSWINLPHEPYKFIGFADAFSRVFENGVGRHRHRLVRFYSANLSDEVTTIKRYERPVFDTHHLPERYQVHTPRHYCVTAHPSGVLVCAMLAKEVGRGGHSTIVCYIYSQNNGYQWSWGGRLFGYKELGFEAVGSFNKFGSPQIMFDESGNYFEVICDGHPDSRDMRGKRLYVGMGKVA